MKVEYLNLTSVIYGSTERAVSMLAYDLVLLVLLLDFFFKSIIQLQVVFSTLRLHFLKLIVNFKLIFRVKVSNKF